MSKKLLLLPIVGGIALALAACSSSTPEPSATPSETATSPTSTATPGNVQVVLSDKPRSGYENVPDADVAQLVDGNTQFAFDLYQQLKDENGNLFLSPHSISLALSMTYAGASGETEIEMQQALHFTLEQARLHAAMNALDQELAKRGEQAPADEKFRLEIANSIWGQQGFPFEEKFLDTLAEDYGAGMRLVDFVPDDTREAARLAINQWVEDNTEGRIKDLVPKGAIDTMTRLVLVNAIYFKASWLYPFDAKGTSDAQFTRLDGSAVATPMMNMPFSSTHFNYGEGDGYQALELPYVGGSTSMLILLPETGSFDQFESSLDANRLNEIISGMKFESGSISIPKFEFDSQFALPDALMALGMKQAFDPDVADFSGMSTADQLYISGVLHKAFVSVDEDGTEAAAATAVIVGTTSMPQESFTFDANHPFIFLIRDNQTGEVLFLGRVLDPTAS